MKLAWVTDPHLNFLGIESIRSFCDDLKNHDSDAVVITGDIAEATSIELCLSLLGTLVKKPIYFVLGNHDFYHGSVGDVRCTVSRLVDKYDNLFWMNKYPWQELLPNVGIVGADGWYDCRSGSFITSPFVLSDFRLIQEYKDTYLSKEDILIVSNEILQPSLQHTAQFLDEALNKYDHVFFITHVPPFTQLSRYKDGPSESDALPFFSCVSLGEVILDAKEKHPNKTITILAGHTHFSAELHVDNMHGYVASAEYGFPAVYKTITVE